MERYRHSVPAFMIIHLFFDDDGRVYLIYGNKKLTLVELNDDLSGVKTGGTNQVIIENSSLPSGNDSGLGEGSQLFKVNGKYFLFNITWPRGGMRTVVIHRADKITGPWEGKARISGSWCCPGRTGRYPRRQMVCLSFPRFRISWTNSLPRTSEMGRWLACNRR